MYIVVVAVVTRITTQWPLRYIHSEIVGIHIRLFNRAHIIIKAHIQSMYMRMDDGKNRYTMYGSFLVRYIKELDTGCNIYNVGEHIWLSQIGGTNTHLLAFSDAIFAFLLWLLFYDNRTGKSRADGQRADYYLFTQP